ncbi:MAG: cadherin-like beta sandwich domain-containing protein [Clostridia bacterium]|nr:cadherin-like beta sandwich domain-containing protein [Clostridia bacterium]
MKKSFKYAISYFMVIMVAVSTFTFSTFAVGGSVSLNKSTCNIGDTITVTVNIDAGEEMASMEAYVKYNKSVLSFQNQGLIVAEGENIKIVATPGGAKTYQASFSLTAIAAGSAEIELFNISYVYLNDPNLNPQPKPVSGDKKTVTVTTPVTPDPTPTPNPDPKPEDKPTKSSNANLGSLSVKDGILSPNFNSATTSYTATVRYEKEETTVFANAQVGTSTVSGAGDYKLEVGDNKAIITVVAEDGTKKTYEVNIKRLTEEETAKLDMPDIELTPLDVELNGFYYRVREDISDIAVPHGFISAVATYNDIQVGVIMDSASSEYMLYYLTQHGANIGDYYFINDSGTFQRLNYITVNGRLYIVEKPYGNNTAPDGWEDCIYTLHTGKVPAFEATESSMKGFYIFYCYVDGERGFYRYDSVQNTIQRDPGFDLNPLNYEKEKDKAVGLFGRFMTMSFAGKAVIVLILLAVLFIITIVILVIIKFIRGAKSAPQEQEAETLQDAQEELLLDNEEDDENFTLGDEQPTEDEF